MCPSASCLPTPKPHWLAECVQELEVTGWMWGMVTQREPQREETLPHLAAAVTPLSCFPKLSEGMKGERGPAGAPGPPGQRGNDGRDGELGLPGQKGAEVCWTFSAIFPLSVNTLTYKQATCFTKSTVLFHSPSGFIASITDV